jgi:hypothetical protein
VLFCSDLLGNPKMEIDTSAFYDKLLSLGVKRITEFVNACQVITPRDCVWWYSDDWETEQEVYTRHLRIHRSYSEPRKSEYYGRAKLLISSGKKV